MKIKNLLVTITLLTAGAVHCQQSDYSFQFPFPAQKSVILNLVNDIKNDNGHVITQKNMMQMGMPGSTALNGYAPGHAVQLRDLAQAMLALCLAHKGTIIVGSLIGAYGYLLTKLYLMEKKVNQQPGPWGAWHHETPLVSLIQHEPKELAHELFKEMKARYLPADYSPEDFLKPLVGFTNDCQKEREELEQFLALRVKLTKTKIAYVVPAQIVAIAKAKDRIERLGFLQSLMLHWLTEYSL